MSYPQGPQAVAFALCVSIGLAAPHCAAENKTSSTTAASNHVRSTAAQATTSPAARFAAYGHDGAWLLQPEGRAPRLLHGATLARTPQVPASSFKVLLALIALDTGALRGADEVVPWNRERYRDKPEWQADMTLRDAMRTSSEPYFRTLAARIGRDRLAAWVDRVGYGNRRIGADPARAWHDGVLRVTAEQQLAFIERLRREDLPFDRATIAAVKATLLESEADGRRVYGKTGTHSPRGETPGVGWWIGWVEGGGAPAASFALAVELKTPDERRRRIALAEKLLIDAKLWTAR